MIQNRFHRYLKLPVQITKLKMFDTFPNDIKHEDLLSYRDANIENFHKMLGITTRHVEVFYTPPFKKIPIHVDGPEFDDHVKINQTWGPEEGVTQWFTSNYQQTAKTYTGEFSERPHNVIGADEKDCTLVWKANTNKPSLVNVGVLHGTDNPTDKGRWTICFVPAYKDTNKSIPWDNALEIYKDYLE